MKNTEMKKLREHTFQKERESNPAFCGGEKMFRRIFLWWSVFNAVMALAMIAMLFLSGNAFAQLILFVLAVPAVCALAMTATGNGNRILLVISMIGGIFGLLQGILLMRDAGFASGTAWAKIYVFLLLIVSAVQIVISLFVLVNRQIGDYLDRKRKLERMLKGQF